MARKKKAGGNRKSGKDAIAFLTKDHEKVRGLLRQLEKATSRAAGRRAELLEKIAQEIRVHSRIEEEVFYPAYHEAAMSAKDAKLFFEAHEEHALVDVVLPQLEEEEPSGEVFAAKAKVLKDLIEHHAEEEEDEMFPRARKLMSKDELAELGARLEARKAQLM